MKKYWLIILVFIVFVMGTSALIRSEFETNYDHITSFPINEYRRIIGLIFMSISGFLSIIYNIFLIKKLH